MKDLNKLPRNRVNPTPHGVRVALEQYNKSSMFIRSLRYETQWSGTVRGESASTQVVSHGTYSVRIRVQAHRYYSETREQWMIHTRRRHLPGFFNGQRRLDRVRRVWSNSSDAVYETCA